MMGRRDRDQGQLFYEFSLDEMIPPDHLLRRINVFATAVLADLHERLRLFCLCARTDEACARCWAKVASGAFVSS
jgi:hypothetical protein